LVKLDRRSETSPGNGKKGGRPFMSVTDFAKQFLHEHSRGDMSLLQYWNGDWWRFEGGIWTVFQEEELRIQITRFLQKLSVDKDGRISTVLINDTILNLKGLCGLIGITMPCWLPDGKDASDIVCFSNELVSIEKLISEKEQAVKSHTPAYFGSDCVEYAYNPAAECPMWVDYLQTTFDDEDSRMALQMMFGYILSGKIDKNIGFFLIGRGGDGKSVAAHILRKLVGESQTCCLPFANLGDRFSSYLLTEHKLNLVEELPVSAEVHNISDAEKVFKMVTDGAVIPVERKYHAPQEKRAKARCVFLANELPQFVDRSNGLWDRLIVLPFTRRFRDTDSEKANLKYELETELSGIFNWAIVGARNLATLPRFPVPQASREYLTKHRLACDHEAAFLHEAVITDPEGFCPKQELYKTYRQWTEDHGYKPFGADRFNAAVKATFPEAQEKRQRSPYDWLVWEGIRFSEGTITEKE
jgi:putative DNA primase/helicase